MEEIEGTPVPLDPRLINAYKLMHTSYDVGAFRVWANIAQFRKEYPAAPQDGQAETTDHRVRNTKDVSLLRIDHISIEPC
jgi:hypothetical protein